jgi:DNA polymerase I
VIRPRIRKYFRNIVVVDFEYEINPGGLPDVLCMVAYVLDKALRHVRTIRLWRGEFGAVPPFDIGDDTLVVGYSLWAEMTCFLQLGWKFPIHLFDQHTGYIATTNVLAPYDPEEVRQKPPRSLDDACMTYNIIGWEHIDKKTIAKDIGEGRWRKYGQPAVFDYCEEDVCNEAELFRRQIGGYRSFAALDSNQVLHWSNYAAKDVARIQAKGMPIDVDLWWLVQEHKAAVIGALIQRFDPSYGNEFPIYSPEGEWSTKCFEWWLISVGIVEWPRLESGALALKGDVFRMMYGIHPAIEGLHALRDALSVIIRARIPIGPDGRNRPSLFPFGVVTGRNAQAKSLYNAHASMRSFMKFPLNKIGLYLDWRTQEVGVAAARSGDSNLIKDYLDGDIYHALARCAA